MTYATQAILADRFDTRMLIELTDRGEVPAGAIDAEVVTRALIDADAVIDGYLAGKYRLPLAEVPPMLVDLASSIAIYKLHRYEPDAKIVKDYEQAMRTLRDIASGAVRLPLEGVEPAARNDGGVKTTDRARPFSNENLTGFV
ncbi:DUF1320 domain-containing protein [Aurantiacibacter xanthus]|uniref:DUF1320 domain-containing protein n=1 Tax=Aurantiacibacter xanthus TaxID=1784712 RepID=A0A3A1P1C6_9SPHN|nr:DUF1320 domain-containing protein [Aurantiacibacter xanthus]RIV82953.1 DUF1320 domain-containing protein [Aurantiacibacter xanthus]